MTLWLFFQSFFSLLLRWWFLLYSFPVHWIFLQYTALCCWAIQWNFLFQLLYISIPKYKKFGSSLYLLFICWDLLFLGWSFPFEKWVNSVQNYVLEWFYNGCFKSERKWSRSIVSDSCNPMDCSLPGSSIHGTFQAIILEWVAISFSRRSSWPRDWTWVSRIVGRCFTVGATREVLALKSLSNNANISIFSVLASIDCLFHSVWCIPGSCHDEQFSIDTWTFSYYVLSLDLI